MAAQLIDRAAGLAAANAPPETSENPTSDAHALEGQGCDPPMVFTWRCRFAACRHLRVAESGRPTGLSPADECSVCQSRIAVTAQDQALAALIAENLL